MDIFDLGTAARMLALYERLLAGIVARPEAPLSALKAALAAWEKKQREAEENPWIQSGLSRLKSAKPRKITAAGR